MTRLSERQIVDRMNEFTWCFSDRFVSSGSRMTARIVGENADGLKMERWMGASKDPPARKRVTRFTLTLRGLIMSGWSKNK